MARPWAPKDEYERVGEWGALPGLHGPGWPYLSAVPTHPLPPRIELWEILPFAPIFEKANLIVNLK